MSFSSFLSPLLIALLVFQPMPAQSLANSAPLVLSAVNADGSNAVAGARAHRGFTLQVSDAAGTPVADAAVVVRFPDSGPTASFSDGSHAGVAYTDVTGRAEITGMQWGSETGVVPVKITVTKGPAHAGIIVEEQILANSGAAPATAATIAPENAAPQPPETGKTSKSETAAQAVQDKGASVPEHPKQQQPGTLQSQGSPATMPASLGPSVPPAISVTNRPSNEKLDTGGGHKKWVFLLLAVAAGAGAGIAFAGKKGSSSSSSTSSTGGATIGAPTVNVGAP